jgi:hypothetical protein
MMLLIMATPLISMTRIALAVLIFVTVHGCKE